MPDRALFRPAPSPRFDRRRRCLYDDAMGAIVKTQAMRALEAKGVAYHATTYDASGEFHSGEEAAALAGAPAETVYKTLVVIREATPGAKPLMVMIASDVQLDLKLLAKATGDKRLRMATQREAERLSGMKVGGISALGLQRPSFEILIDDVAREMERIHVSAGVRGTDIELAVVDLVAVTGARFVQATV
jgi:Cys-tRNA(Pro)/Cys-tRNA(Cys) deacylase